MQELGFSTGKNGGSSLQDSGAFERLDVHVNPAPLTGGRWGGQQSKSHTGLPVLALTCKELGSHTFHPYKKKTEQTEKSRDFSWTHQKIEVTGQTTTPQSTET
jgi:hypothetical protein